MRRFLLRHICWVSLLLLPVMAIWPMALGISSNPINDSGLALQASPGWLRGGINLDLTVGVLTQALGHQAAEQWMNGQVPWWNPFNGVGLPLGGLNQASALFFPVVLLLHFQSGPILLKLLMQMIGGVSMFALLRRLEVSRAGSWLGGLVFALNGTFAWLSHQPIMPPAFLPLIILGIENARFGGYRLLALAMACSIYAGHPETAYIDGLLALAWAIFRVIENPQPLRMAMRVALGGTLALLLSAPVIWSFAHMVANSSVGPHEIALFAAPVPAIPVQSYAVWLFPYLFGPLAAYGGEARGLSKSFLDGSLGGYLGVAMFVLVLLSLAAPTRRGLRLTLVIWIVLCWARGAAVPGITHLINLIPLTREVTISRYAVPSWHFAAVVLTVLAVEDWRAGTLSRRWLAAVPWCAGGVAVLALLAAWSMLALLRAGTGQHAFLLWPLLAMGWGVLTGAGVLWLVARVASPRRLATLLLVITLDAAVMFTLPMLSGVRDMVLDMPAVAFLHDNLGLQRFYTLGPYHPNYGAYFDTAQINHEYLPVPTDWVAYVHGALDPSTNELGFRGTEPALPPDVPSHADQMVRNLANYEKVGVRYVVVEPGQNPFVSQVRSADRGTQPITRPLDAGSVLQGDVSGTDVPTALLDAMGLAVGTYFGKSDGVLHAELCGQGGCASGVRPISELVDNAVAMVPLQPVLPVQQGEALRWRVWTTQSTHVLAIYLQAGRTSAEAPAPLLTFARHTEMIQPRTAYQDSVMTVYELPHASPYFEVQEGRCRLSATTDRTRLEADCDGPATLVRRELFFPGWRAWVNDRPVEITAFENVMQRIDLPSGASRIRFHYAPPYSSLCWLLALAAAIGLIVRPRRGLFAGPVVSA